MVKIARVVREICSRTDRQTHRETHKHTDALITILRHRCSGRSNEVIKETLDRAKFYNTFSIIGLLAAESKMPVTAAAVRELWSEKI